MSTGDHHGMYVHTSQKGGKFERRVVKAGGAAGGLTKVSVD